MNETTHDPEAHGRRPPREPDENGRYPACPTCGAPLLKVVENEPYPESDGETWAEYTCGQWRPDSDPTGDYSGTDTSCAAFLAMRYLHRRCERAEFDGQSPKTVALDHNIGEYPDGCEACAVWSGRGDEVLQWERDR